MAIPSSYSTSLTELKSIMGQSGLRAGMMFLNGLTAHRFTAVYRFDRETLRNLYFYDCENPAVETMADIPVLASYCVFVRDQGKTFITANARADDRLGNHPKRAELQSYCGVPLRDAEGNMFGTICHFDFAEVSISPENVDLMEAVAPLLRNALA